MNFTALNKRLESLNSSQEDISHLYARQLAKSLEVEKEQGKKLEELNAREAANLIQYKISDDKSFVPDEFKGYYDFHSNKFTKEQLWSALPNNDEYYFLASIRRNKPSDETELLSLARDYNLERETLFKLKEDNLLDWLDIVEVDTLDNFKKGNYVDDDIISSFEERGFISRPSNNERELLSFIKDKEICIDSNLFKKLCDKLEISPKRISALTARNSHLDILTTDQANWLEGGAKTDLLGQFELSELDFKKIKHRITFYSKNEIKSIDKEYLTDEQLHYIQAIKEGMKAEDLKTLKEKLQLDNEDVFLLKNRIEYYKGDEIKSINLNAIIDATPRIRFSPHSKYFEPLELLEERKTMSVTYELKRECVDSYLLISDSCNDIYEFSRTDFERISELKAHNKKINDAIVPSNQELSFLEAIKWRKFKFSKDLSEDEKQEEKIKLIYKIAKEDFNINEGQLSELVKNDYLNLFTLSESSPLTDWREAKALNKARIYLSTKDKLSPSESTKILVELGIEKPDDNISLLLNGKLVPPPYKEKSIDYNMALKTFRNTPLSLAEETRLKDLRRNGIHPESLEYKKWLYTEHKSWKMEAVRKFSFKKNYKEKYGVNLEILKFVNSFKQVTHEQLLKLGLSEEEIERYTHGIPNNSGKPSGRQKLLNSSILPNPRGKIQYYYINHTGTISGRSFLQDVVKKKEINKKPLQRKDLLFHDLKVPSCVLKTIEMYEKRGYKVKEIKNESAQYSETKSGVKNENRHNGPAFMDAQVVFEKDETMASSSPSKGKSTIVVGVEYGNYATERMASKLENSIYDEAHVFSNERHMKKYQQSITINRLVSFHKI